MVAALASQHGEIATATADALSRDLFASGASAWLAILVAERSRDGMLVGYALMLRTYRLTFAKALAYLEQLYVVPEARRCGAGSALVCVACKRAREGGCVTLRINVVAGNHLAQRFYKATGVREERHGQLSKRLLRGALHIFARTTGWPSVSCPLQIDLTTSPSME
jgi:ribosomal protein S18 acetylase RimI-like enzyme